MVLSSGVQSSTLDRQTHATGAAGGEAALADASHYRAIFENSLEAIMLTTPDGEVLAANAEACKLFQREPEEMRGLGSANLTDPEDGRVATAWVTRKRTGRFAGLVTMRRRDETRFEADITTTLFRDSSGALLSYVFLRDVTERHRSEKALLASEHRYRSLIETTGNVLIGVAPDGMIFEWNREAERIFGYARREVLGRNYFDLCVDPARQDGMRADVRRVLDGDTLRFREDEIVSRSGVRRAVLWNVTRLLDVSARPLGVIASGQDITERKQLEAQLQHGQKLESLGVLAGGIAHDFNNLLVGILGNASLALMDIDEGSPLHEVVKDIETTALRAAELTKQMLAYSGRGRFIVRPLGLSQLVEEMAHLLQTVISKRAALTFDFARPIPPVEADATQIRQIVMNLITNASDALNGENGTVILRTGVMRADREYLHSPYLDYQLDEGLYAYVEVADSGMGMTPETMQRIFDPFFSTKFTGRGLGLAATLGIVRGHRGSIRVTSVLGEGTTIRVLLPVRSEDTDLVDALEESADEVRGSGTVLVVDDDPTVRAVARHMLERRGFRVIVAQDGVDGLASYERERESLALAFIDLTMPRMGGDELIRAIRRNDAELPLILMSGFSELELAGQFPDELIAAFVQKPFRVAELDRSLRLVLTPAA